MIQERWVIKNSDQGLNILPIELNENVKTLGLYWASNEDYLVFNLSSNVSRVVTKRVILSISSQIFDPLGLVVPCTTRAKILLQLIWQEILDWDDTVPCHIQNQWIEFRDELNLLNEVKIPRHAICRKPSKIELHGFADASEQAYGACVYIRGENEHGHITTRLLCSKSKVAPLKTITMPRLELCAALVLAKIIKKAISSLRVKFEMVTLWSDSQIVLAWLQTPPNVLKIFVANRIVQIQELTSGTMWQYVHTSHNPADVISRGCTPKDLITSSLWWYGPEWLSEPRNSWPEQPAQTTRDASELRPQIFMSAKSEEDPIITISKFSSLNRLSRTVAYCHRFIYNARQANLENRRSGYLNPTEIAEAVRAIAKIDQFENYRQELRELKKHGHVKSSSSIASLAPFLDETGLMRVGGRLQLSYLKYDEKHPIVLDGRKHFSALIYRDIHERLAHAGVQHMMCIVREKFWPVKGKNTAKRIVRECTRCFRARPSNVMPQMGILPKSRVTPTLPFAKTEVDYTGPFFIKTHKGRGAQVTKCYLSLFVCLAMKAIHVEVVSDLSTDAFIATPKRFMARRGRPQSIHSDNGTNYVGAERELKQLLYALQAEQEKITDYLTTEGISWYFIPPNSPHFRRIWEAAVKGAKFHIKRVLHNISLTFENYYTLTCQVEAILNSRPLSPLSNDPKDLEPLTPSHFLIGRKQTAIPEPNLLHLNSGRLSNYQRIQQMIQSFWARWSHAYLQQLQIRKKWKLPLSNLLRVGDLVLLKEDNQPPLSWPLGRIIDLYSGPDQTVREASIRTQKGIYKREVAKLFPLPSNEPSPSTRSKSPDEDCARSASERGSAQGQC